MGDLIPVRVRDCACPDTPHEDGDFVFVLPRPSLACGLEAREDVRQSLGSGTLLAERWLVTFVKHGAVAWNWTDEDGDPLPFDVSQILGDFDLAEPVAEKCDELYGETVTRPFLESIRKLSQRGRTAGSTSQTPGKSGTTRSSSRAGKSRPTPRKPSSPRSTAGAR